MKVVLFCGGQGLRLREFSETLPKPMVPIGHRPIIWHLMKYYAHYGHRDFILCLGHKSDVIKSYFRNYDETVSNDFVLRDGGRSVELLNADIQNWSITFVDTGIQTSVGERLRAVREHLRGEDWFLANYSDGLSDVPLPSLIEHFKQEDKVAGFLCVRPPQTFHVVKTDSVNHVTGFLPVVESDLWINGGFFCLKREIFDYLDKGDELVLEAFQKLIPKGELVAHRYAGFWACMDTFKELQMLDDLWTRGHAPWEVWRRGGNREAGNTAAPVA